MLTGKNKEQFEKWYISQRYQLHLVNFYGLEDSMQFGVVVDYADSIGIQIGTKVYYGTFAAFVNHYYIQEKFQTRDEARLAAIKAFDEIVNRDTRKVNHKK